MILSAKTMNPKSDNQLLPVTVIIPSLDSVDSVKGHLSSILEDLKNVERVIVVDSSPPEVLTLYREMLEGFPVEIHQLPPGLYQAWNFAIRRVETEYVYISTIGDTLLEGGLDHLVDVASKTSADVVISPPRMLSSAGVPDDSARWPTHDVIEALAGEESPGALRGPMAVMLFSSFLPSSVLGSSASNLYRSQILKENPFPEDLGPQGDVVWAFKNSPHLQFAFTKRVCANFQLVERHGELAGQAQASNRMFQALADVLEDRFAGAPRSAEMSLARGWSKCVWKHYKWTHEYVHWHEELREWSEKLETWNAFLEKRDKSFAGRLAGLFSRVLFLPGLSGRKSSGE